MSLFDKLSIEDRLKATGHPWVLFMRWCELLFASWRVPAETLRPLVPAELEIDTFDGSAWVTLVPMRVADLHWRGVPPIPGMDEFLELNLRTYIKRKDRPGVYFLSIECPAAFSNWMARTFFNVPYYDAQMIRAEDSGTYHLASQRKQPGVPEAVLFARYGAAAGTPALPAPGSLDAFLVERFSLYFVQQGSVYRGDIEHSDWMVQEGRIEIDVNTISSAAGLQLSSKPDHVGFSLSTDSLVYPAVREDA